MPIPADLFLSPDFTEAEARAYLAALGFRDAAAVDDHLQRMADDIVVREALGRLAPDLIPALLDTRDPDAAVMGMAHYVAARTGRAMFLDYLREDPRALHVLLSIMGASPTLSEILIRTPEYFHWLVSQVERTAPDRQDHEEELVSILTTVEDPVEALNILRRWKRREMLRIGTRDVLGREAVQTAAAQLSDIACVAVDFALAIVMRQLLDAEGRDKAPGTFAIIGTGHLGAHEMSYSPDIELLYVYDTVSGESADGSGARDFFVKAGCGVTAALRDETHEGFLYRVLPPPWPQSDGWVRACSLEEYREHYAASGHSLERCVLTRARAVAGDAELGRQFMSCCQPFVYGSNVGVATHDASGAAASLPDSGVDAIERLTEALQLRHGAAHPPLRHVGTLGALDLMSRAGIIDEALRRELDHAYVFLRSAQHRSQLGVTEDIDQRIASSEERVREICRSMVHGP
jgi:[glutamine synthetase] adenylyltransferase / [glutamine synthetase]-adenylyl-L-tyrosine phosphorylase